MDNFASHITIIPIVLSHSILNELTANSKTNSEFVFIRLCYTWSMEVDQGTALHAAGARSLSDVKANNIIISTSFKVIMWSLYQKSYFIHACFSLVKLVFRLCDSLLIPAVR